MAITLIRKKCHDDLPSPIDIGLDTFFENARNELQKSSNALETLKVVDSSDKEVGLLVVAGGVDSAHMVNSGTSAFSGGIAILNINNPMTIGGTQLSLAISLIHELGHAKQLIEKPQWYMNLYKCIVKQQLMLREGTYGSKKSASTEKNTDVKALIALLGPKPRGYAGPKATQLDVTRKKIEVEKQFDLKYGGAQQTLEMDNIREHEHPVVMDFGYGQECCRQSYPG